jgi:hypothetical protein
MTAIVVDGGLGLADKFRGSSQFAEMKNAPEGAFSWVEQEAN